MRLIGHLLLFISPPTASLSASIISCRRRPVSRTAAGQRYSNSFTLKHSSTGIRVVSKRGERVAFSFFSHIPLQLFIVAFQVGTRTLGCDAAQEEADKKQVAPAATDTEVAQTNGMLNFPPPASPGVGGLFVSSGFEYLCTGAASSDKGQTNGEYGVSSLESCSV